MTKLISSQALSGCMRHFVALILASAACLPAFGEDYGPQDYSIVPPAPQVEALMDFKEYPVNYFSGSPQIDFNIYTLKVGQISVPITLSYHSGGIRVDQKAGNAGLGWNVSCGATISHTVYGAPDEADRGSNNLKGLFHLSSDEKKFRQKLIEKRADYDPTDAANYKNNLSWESTLGGNYYLGQTDVANDLFNLYGQGLSATFALLPDITDPVKQVHYVSENPVKIRKNTSLGDQSSNACEKYGFTVESNDGLTYNFKTQDRTLYKYSHGNPENGQLKDSLYYASAWHLEDIIDLAGNKVKFTYTENASRTIRHSRHPIEKGYSNPEFAATTPPPSGLNGVNETIYYPKILTKIEGNGITVEFDYYFQNSIFRDPLLKSITVTAPSTDSRKYVFSYGYRDLLKAVRDVSDPGKEEVIYKFDYYDDFQKIPYIDEQDFGGYWNGINNGYNMIPSKLFSQGQVGGDADRSVVPEYATDWSLKRITYATGGYTDFEWESNNFSHVKNLEFYGRINSTHTVRIDTDTMRVVTREPEFTKLKINNWYLNAGQLAELDLTQYLAMNPTKYYNTAYSHNNAAKYPEYTEGRTPDYPHVVIRKSSDKSIVKVLYIDAPTVEPNGVKQPTALALDPGRYDFELVNPLAMDGADYDFENEFYYNGSNAGKIYLHRITTDGNRPAGKENWCGLRIKRIKSCAGDEENDVLWKDYYYNIACSPLETSGTVQMLPSYDYMYYESRPRFGIPGYESSEVYCMGETAFPQTPLGAMSNIEYPQVTVKMGASERENVPSYLSTVRDSYVYSSAREWKNADYNHTDFLAYQPVGSRMYTSLSHRRGLLEKRFSPISYPRLRSTEYFYNIHEKEELPVLTTDAFIVSDFSSAPGYNSYGNRDYGIGRYTLIPYNKTIASEITTESKGLHSFKKYDYFYTKYTDALDWNLVKSVSTTDSEDREVSTRYTYASGINSFLPLPETEVTVSGDNVITATRTEYDASTKLPVSKYTLSQSADTCDVLSPSQETTPRQRSVINSLTYQYKYNSKGNLIQISYKGRPLASYIWGYNGMYPVIEATDIDSDSLVAAAKECGLTQAQIDGRSAATDSAISSVAAALRAKLSRSAITAISYHWLFGIAKITTPRGDSSSYSYDGRGRLVEIRDFNNYLISKYDYHYANANDEDYDYEDYDY